MEGSPEADEGLMRLSEIFIEQIRHVYLYHDAKQLYGRWCAANDIE